MPPVKIVLVDDHILFRTSLKSLLEVRGVAETVGEAASPDDVLDIVTQTRPDAVLMDYWLGSHKDNGVTLTRLLRQSFPEIPVIMLTMYEDREVVVAAAKAGIAAFVLKDSSSDELVAAIKTVVNGDAWLSPRIAKQVLAEVMTYSVVEDEGAAAAKHHGLTEREVRVLELVVNGFTYVDMARALLVSVSQIKQHMGSILHKLRANDKAHAAAIAIAQKIVPPPC